MQAAIVLAQADKIGQFVAARLNFRLLY